MSEKPRESSDDVQTVTGGHATSEELVEVIEDAILEVTNEGLTGNEARHAVVDRVMAQVDDPSARAVVTGHVHARMDLG